MFVAHRYDISDRVKAIIIRHQSWILIFHGFGQGAECGNIHAHIAILPFAFDQVLAADIFDALIDTLLLQGIHANDHRESETNSQAKNIDD